MRQQYALPVASLVSILATLTLISTPMPARCQTATNTTAAPATAPLPPMPIAPPAFNRWVVKARYDEAAQLARTASRGSEADVMEAVRAFQAVRDMYRGSRYGVMAAWDICQLIKSLKPPPKPSSALESFVATYPQSDYAADALWALISHLNKARDDRAASAKYEEFVRRFPKSPYIDDIFYSRASQARKDYDFATVIESYQRIIQLCPDSDYCDNGYYSIGSTYSSYLDNYEQALASYQQLIQKFPYSDYVDDCLYSGLTCLMYMDDIEGAISLYNQIVTKYPASYAAARGPGRLERYIGDRKSLLAPNPNETLAVPLYQQVTDLLKRADGAAYMHRYPEAVRLYQQVLNQFPTCDYADDAIMKMAGCFDAMRKYRERARTAATPEEIADVERDWAYALGSGVGGVGRARDAVSAYLLLANEFVGSDLRDDALSKAAAAYEAIEYDVAALLCYLELIRRFPRSRYATTAVTKVNTLRKNLKSPADKMRVCAAVAEAYPEHPYSDDYLFEIGLLYMDAGDTLNARRSMENYLAKYSQRALAADALFLLGRCYQIVDKPQAAGDPYRRIMALYPNSGLADDAFIELQRFSTHGAEEAANATRREIGIGVEEKLERSIRGHDVILRPHIAVIVPFRDSATARAYNLPDVFESAYVQLAQFTGVDPGNGKRIPIVLDSEYKSWKAGPPIQISTRYAGEPPAYATCFEPLAQLFLLDPSIASVTNAVSGFSSALARIAALQLDHYLFQAIGEMELGPAASTAHLAALETAKGKAIDAVAKHLTTAAGKAKAIPRDAIFGVLLQSIERARQGPGEIIDWAPLAPLLQEAHNVPPELRALKAPEEKAALLLACLEKSLGRE
ncbi:MAG: tol-pal system YbgF family protein, partial [Armatimonadota bacterium]